MPAERLALNDCDRYFDWRASGGYVTTFKVRSKEVTYDRHFRDEFTDNNLQE